MPPVLPLLLMQHAYSQHLQSKQLLLEPLLLADEVGEEGGEEGQQAQQEGGKGRGWRQGGGVQPQVCSYWASKPWWAGLVLVLLSVALCAVTVYTVFSASPQA